MMNPRTRNIISVVIIVIGLAVVVFGVVLEIL